MTRKESSPGTPAELLLFLRRLALFGVFALALAAVFRELDREFVFRTVDIQDRALNERIDEIDTLIMGDSHAAAIDYRLTPGTFNMSTPAESIIQTYYRLRGILDREPARLERVLYSVGLHTFMEGKHQDREDPHYWVRHVDFFELAERMPDPWPVLSEALLGYTGFFGQGVDIWRGLRRRFSDWIRGKEPRSWDSRLQRWDLWAGDMVGQSDEQIASQLRFILQTHTRYGTHFDPVLARYFEDFLALCRSRGLEVHVFDAPVMEAYFELMSAEVDVAVHDRFVAEAVARHGATLLDFRLSFSDLRYFANPDHVSVAGRMEVTRRVRERLGIPPVKEQP